MLGEVHPPNLVLNTHIYAAYFNLEEVVGVFSGLVSHDLLQVLFEHFVLVCNVEHQYAHVESLLQVLVT